MQKYIKQITITLLVLLVMASTTHFEARNKQITMKSSVVVRKLNQIAKNGRYGKRNYNGYCLRFVADFWSNYGASRSSAYSAIAYGKKNRVSTRMDNIPEGADVYFDNTLIHGNPAGHIGIYIGNGQFVSAMGNEIRIDSLDEVRKNNVKWSELFYGWGYHENVTLIDDVGPFTVAPIADQIVTGESITPKLNVTVDGQAVKENRDYTLEFSNNVKLGTASIKIIGKNNYQGSQDLSFNIVKRQLSVDDFTLEQEEYTYTGKQIKPKVVAKYKNLTYKVTYRNNIEEGEGTIVIRGQGACTGTIKKTFTITMTTKDKVNTQLSTLKNRFETMIFQEEFLEKQRQKRKK